MGFCIKLFFAALLKADHIKNQDDIVWFFKNKDKWRIPPMIFNALISLHKENAILREHISTIDSTYKLPDGYGAREDSKQSAEEYLTSGSKNRL